jgi:hypothetical protein
MLRAIEIANRYEAREARTAAAPHTAPIAAPHSRNAVLTATAQAMCAADPRLSFGDALRRASVVL